jgi:gluconate 2-dehydrogenase gamma chain
MVPVQKADKFPLLRGVEWPPFGEGHVKEYSSTRRSALRGIGLLLGAGAVGLDFSEMARAAHDAHLAASDSGPRVLTLLGAADAADVEALTSQIVPSDESPGAREAGVTYFIDRALGSFFAHWRLGFMQGLGEFQTAARVAHPDAASFAALSETRQIDFLHTIDQWAFFDQARLLTLCGLFSSPVYGGNRDQIGWKLLGFEDQHIFEPPFGYYDRDPGA